MNFLFRQINIASLVFFRIIFGILAFADVLGIYIYQHLYLKAFDPNGFQFQYYGFQWVRPLPEPLMSAVFITSMLAAICIALGKWYRLSTTVFAFSFFYFFLLEKSFYLNHGYLFTVICFLMIMLPANRAFSADVLRQPRLRVERIAYWPLFLLQFSMAAVYFFGGIAKINPDWLQAQPMKSWLPSKGDMPLIGWLWSHDWTPWVMSYGGLALDLFIVFFLIIPRTRLWALGFVIFFHFTNFLLFQIGIFPFLSISLSLLFFPSDFPLRVYKWLKGQRQHFQRIEIWWQGLLLKASEAGVPAAATIYYGPFEKRTIKTFIVFYMAFHMLMPLRHHYFKGDVAWTEEGHRYAWRMMLRAKSGYGHFDVVNLQTGERVKVEEEEYLSKRQRRKMFTHPDMILKFAHFLEAEYRKKGWTDIAVYADVRVKLNQHSHQQYTDPEVDLTKKEWSFWKESDFILPFQ